MAVVKVFEGVHGGLGLPGLLALAKEKKTKVGEGNYLMFVNRKRTRAKIVFGESLLLIYAKASGEITLEELLAIPAAIGGVKADWFPNSIAEKITKMLNRPISSSAESARAA